MSVPTKSSSFSELGCDGIARFVDAYLDGEFAEGERRELELHVERCEACRQLVRDQADWKRCIRQAAMPDRAPPGLADRIRAGLDEADHAPVPWRRWAMTVLPVAAAAGLALTWGLARVGLEPAAMTADVVAKHQRNMPMEVAGEAERVQKWYADKVDFPVRPPAFQGKHAPRQVALKGGRLADLRDKQAAYLVYDVDGNKVSVFVFDPSRMSLAATRHRRVGDRDVYLDAQRGYNVALYRDHDLGYAIAADLPEERLLDLVSASLSE